MPATVGKYCEAIQRKEYWIDHRLIKYSLEKLGRHMIILVEKTGNMDPNNGKRTGRRQTVNADGVKEATLRGH